MKKLLSLLFAAAFALAVSAAADNSAPADNRTVLATSTADGITTTLYVGRVQADPAKDGTLILTVFPAEVITVAATGRVVSERLATDKGFSVPLTAQQYAGLSALVQAAYTAANPPANP